MERMAASRLSNTQIDQLGDRLRKAKLTTDDLTMLDGYRRSFSDAHEQVIAKIRDQLGLEPTGRPAKSTTSITEKLRRESIRLSQMQDIAGCRITVRDLDHQNYVVTKLSRAFEKVVIVDRREQPSHGYRAVHVIVDSGGKLVEIQVRTYLQHLWAELSEKLSDIVDNSIKYGGGEHYVRQLLSGIGDNIRELEAVESQFNREASSDPEQRKEMEDEIREMRKGAIELLRKIGDVIPKVKRERQ